MRALMAPSRHDQRSDLLAPPSHRAFWRVTTPNKTSFRLLLRVSPDFAALPLAWCVAVGTLHSRSAVPPILPTDTSTMASLSMTSPMPALQG